MDKALLRAALHEEIDIKSENDDEDGIEELCSKSNSRYSSSGTMNINSLDMVTLEKNIASNRPGDSEQTSIGDDLNKDTFADESLNLEEMRERVKQNMTRVAELGTKSEANVNSSGKPGVDSKLTGQQGKYTCEICNKEFFNEDTLRIHVQDHSSLGPHSCTFCKATFAEQGQLLMHLNSVHSTTEPYKCKYCKQKFSQYSDLDKHLEKHADEKAFSCKICKKKFKYRSFIKKHMLTQKCGVNKANKNIEKVKTNVMTHECTVCGDCFRNSLHLEKHYQMVHSDTLISP